MDFYSRPLRAIALAGIVLISAAVNAGEFVPNEVIVKYKHHAARTRAEVTALYDRAGVKRVRYFSERMGDFEQLILKDGVSVENAIARLSASPMVEYAQPNFLITIPENPVAFEPPPGGGLPGMPGGGDMPMPCIPGFDIPNCDPNLCWLPGVQMPPGCTDWGGGGGGGGGGDDPGNEPPAQKPALNPAPAPVDPPVADPNLSQAWGIAKIGADKAWSGFKGDKKFIVAVIDTGIDYNHEDLSFNIWRNPNPTQGDEIGYDFVHNDGLPYDDQGHGSHTAGTVGAVGGNGVGVSGVAQSVSLMSVKFLSAAGSGETADAIRAIDYAVQHGAKVLSNSWGGKGINDQALHDAIDRAQQADVLFVAAAGNDSGNNDNASEADYPAAFDNDNIVAVAATDKNDHIASFSNFGATSVDLAAPGVDVYSLAPGNQYATHSGTSMACPHVAGAAALIWSKNPSMTYKQVKEALLKSVDKVSGLQGKTVTGGRLNVMNALRSMD